MKPFKFSNLITDTKNDTDTYVLAHLPCHFLFQL